MNLEFLKFYYGTFTFVPALLIGVHLRGYYVYLNAFYMFVIMSLLELTGLEEVVNPSEKEVKDFKDDPKFKIIGFFYPILQFCVIMYLMYFIYSTPDLQVYELFGIALSMACLSAPVGITLAHELVHKRLWERVFGKFLLCQVFYGHFTIEHVLGHHKRVATPEDPATARLNENVYSFILRTVPGQYLSAWEIERQRLKKLKKGPFSPSNEIIQMHFISLSIAFTIYKLFGTTPLIVYLTHCVFSFLMLELVNYIEHYGLVRMKLENGEYEKVTDMHSWNADRYFTNLASFRLQRHSDHHARAFKYYYALHSLKHSPQLPHGYVTLMILSLFPPVYFSVMNPIVYGLSNSVVGKLK